MIRKTRVGVVFGGRSGEHAVSLASARAVIDAIDVDRYDVVPIGITRSGSWLLGEGPALLESREVSDETPETAELVADITRRGLVPVDRHRSLDAHENAVDVVFPLLHGPYGEDGTVQGLLELAAVPYVGAGVAASAVGMDKAFMKALFEHAGLPMTPYFVFNARDWERGADQVIASTESKLRYPVFVKPCRLGSSVGIDKARDTEELRTTVESALLHDSKIIVEQGVEGREVECGVLGGDDPMVSVFGEIDCRHEFYDYEAKYSEGLSELIIPANLTAAQVRELTDIALKAWAAIDAYGMARVDFFIEHETERVILNEINTIPGFTRTSMFPKVWEASGLSFGDLISRLIDLALERAGR
ncbi:MAG TPA: D-alanine--D-alanine ligase family protein [Chloroflexota bacterium]|nr:D-alanine--D-alanine ligase family protein [Chloroflexota bacterium]